MNEQILALLNALDAALVEAAAGGPLDLYNMGRSALVLHYKLQRVTKDFDILQMRTSLEAKAVELFGKGTANAARLGLYLETVPQGLPRRRNGSAAAAPASRGTGVCCGCGGRSLMIWPRPSSRATGRRTARI